MDRSLLRNGLLLDDTPPARRYLTSHERWFLVRRNIGHPFIVLLLITYPSSSALPNEKALRMRIMELQDRLGGLSCRLKDGRTTRPYWEERPVFLGSAHSFRRTTYAFDESDDTRLSAPSDVGKGELDLMRSEAQGKERGTKEQVLAAEHERMKSLDFDAEDQPPLWQVTFYEHPDSVKRKDEKTYMVLSGLHELIDGRGLVRLSELLLADGVSHVPSETLWDIRTYPDTVDLRPSWGHLLTMGAQHYFPSLASWVAPHAGVAFWPKGQVNVDPLSLHGRMVITVIPDELVQQLKSLGKFHGIPTLTPILQLAYLFAVWSVLRHASGRDANESLCLATNTPITERDPSIGHSSVTGQYNCSHLHSLKIEPSTPFWSTARSIAYQLAHPSGRHVARMRMGMVDYLPDGSVSAGRADDARRCTAWEDWQLRRHEELDPYMASLSFSNIGRISLPAGADGILLAASPSAGDPPFELVLTGTVKGVVGVCTHRDGDILNEGSVRQVGRTWVEILEALVNAGGMEASASQLVSLHH